MVKRVYQYYVKCKMTDFIKSKIELFKDKIRN